MSPILFTFSTFSDFRENPINISGSTAVLFQLVTQHTNQQQELPMNHPTSFSQLHQNYLQLAKKYHPDHSGSTEDFQTLNETYRAIKINYYCNIVVTALEALTGCERFFENEDRQRYVINLPKLVNTPSKLKIEADRCIIHLTVDISLPVGYTVVNGYLIKKLPVSKWTCFWGGKETFLNLENKRTCVRINSSTQHGAIFKLPNQGLYGSDGVRQPLYIQLVKKGENK